ncbi:MAG: dephospho-CoA kinase [Bacteroidetes bacterium]|nr:dephospho-CoA kinase [Bacteroidota bacterium]
MIRVGITGGIGSGKSTVCRVFEVLGIPVYYADAEAKKLLDDPAILAILLEKFGKEIFDGDHIDRKKLAAVVFSDPEKLAFLNSIIHPAVKKHFLDWCDAHSDARYVLKEAAILFESEAYKQVQKVITVTAPAEVRIARVMKRDGTAREEVEKRIASQLNDEEKIKRSDFVLLNDEQQSLIPEILKIHQKLMS